MRNIRARRAITSWLRAKKKAGRRKAIVGYAAEVAGTRFDLDADLESAAIKELMRLDREVK